jgi:Short C-terminal domain
MVTPWSIILIAEEQAKHPPGSWRAPVLWTTLALVVALMLGAIVIALVDRWRKRAAMKDKGGAGEQLSHFRALYDRGELTREEFDRIRTRLGQRLKQELDLNKPAGPPAPEAPARPPDAPPSGNGAGSPPETPLA